MKPMKPAALPLCSFAKLAAAALSLSALTGVAFASWLDEGPEMFMALAQSGLAWCF
jgi:hypothetical protein